MAADSQHDEDHSGDAEVTATSGSADLTPSPVLNLGLDTLWQQPWFHERLIEALRNESVRDDVVAIWREWLPAIHAATWDDFRSAALTRLSELPEGTRAAFEQSLSDVGNVRTFNDHIYSTVDPFEVRTFTWPNNPKLLATDWNLYADVFEADFMVEPCRFITPETPIVSAGSCFAANISRQLQGWGYNYLVEMGNKPSREPGPDGKIEWEKFETDPAKCGPIYNSATMRQMVERAFGEWKPEKLVLGTDPFIDPFRGTPNYKDEAGFHKDYEDHSAALNRAMSKAEVFILTLGMTEAWYFAHNGSFTYASPRATDRTLLRCVNLTVEQNVAELERLLEVYVRHNPKIKIILTVSPVPINKTFRRDQHVVVANALSKSTLRVASEIFASRHPDNVYYFPAYELVTVGTKEPWEIDQRHVSNTAVERVMRQFQRQFMIDQSPKEFFHAAPIETFIPTRRNYPLYVARKIGRPIKRALGIRGRVADHVAGKIRGLMRGGS